MKVLHLPLKKEWYNMIESGVKTEEYREIKPYWAKRLCPCMKECANVHRSEPHRCIHHCKAVYSHMNFIHKGRRIANFTHVRFSYGYTKRTMTKEKTIEFYEAIRLVILESFEEDETLDYDEENEKRPVTQKLVAPDVVETDWLNAHHFDYRGLIERGLAIDATEMNIYKR